MTEIPDDVVELAAREYCDFDGGFFDSMRHALSLPEVRAALAPSPVPPQDGVTAQSALSHCLNGVRPYDRAATIIKALAGHGYVIVPALVPVVSQAERMAWKAHDARVKRDPSLLSWPQQDDDYRIEWEFAFQALIDDGTIPPEPEPDVAEMLALSRGWSGDSSFACAVRGAIADGWTVTPPPVGTEKGGE